ncbi:endo alpha-1,4 polygalactosaminidase [bacterium]|nr:endo alpha-1,4 polygalactosaminidase [bacterium]MBU1958219.1 endo alpha-1,4 polygalactosaminidase [bacterium]
MKLSCCSKIVFLFSLLFSSVMAEERYAFIYSNNIDDQFINFYDKVVVEADAIDNIYALRYPKKMVAYVSVGEIEPWRKTKTKYDPSWIISENKTWNSLIADLRKDAYQNFIFERIEQLYSKGYRNFFLDTMDAYHVTAKDKELFGLQQKALIKFIRTLHKKYPKSKIIVNRGFELLEKIHKDIDAIVAESLLNRYNHDQKAYVEVPKADREWLIANFNRAKSYNLDVISIEYSNKSTKERMSIAKRVKELGFIAYVTDGLLQEQGECDLKRVRRDVLILFNQSLYKDKNAAYSDVHRLASMPLEHLGYVPILYDISTKDLPQRVEDRYHSVIVWSNGKTKNDEKLYAWTQKLKEKNIKILFLNSLVFTPSKERLSYFGLKEEVNENDFLSKTTVHYHQPYTQYEIPASINYEERIIKAKEAQAVLSISYENGQNSTPIAITSWGGYALNNSLLYSIGDEIFWNVDPFKLFKDALSLDTIPLPDPTTEAGRRILFVHVDGDGYVEQSRTNREQLASDTLIEEIYKKYPIPQSVSLIQGEVDSIGMFPQLSPRMKESAKELYRIPWIEPASHTLSHPFFWNKVTKPENAKPEVGKNYHLPIPNYHFSLDQEITGSIRFALSLAPKSKQKEKVIFWTGDCLPTKKILGYIERKNILAINGGDTNIQKNAPWLSHIAPFGLQHDAYWQIYTAQQNENVFTHEWTGPFWGYRNAIETFEMTEEPRRVKPINIYYHFYSGSKLASLKALDEVYSWSIKQKTSKLYTSQYIKKVKDFYATSLAKVAGGYEVRNSGHLRTLRVDKEVYVNMQKSQGVAGFIHNKGRTYITLDQQTQHTIILSDHKPSLPYLKDANGWVERVEQQQHKYIFTLKANMPLKANFYLPSNCNVMVEKGIKQKKMNHRLSLKSTTKKGSNVVFICQ